MAKACEWRANLPPEERRAIVETFRKLILAHGMGQHLAFASHETIESWMVNYRNTEWE